MENIVHLSITLNVNGTKDIQKDVYKMNYATDKIILFEENSDKRVKVSKHLLGLCFTSFGYENISLTGKTWCYEKDLKASEELLEAKMKQLLEEQINRTTQLMKVLELI